MKHIWMACMIFLVAKGISAQENKFGIRLGIGGVNSSQIIGPWLDPAFLSSTSNSEAFKQSGHFSFRAGFLVDIYLNDVLSFQPEVLYTTSGVKNTRPNHNVIINWGDNVMLEEEEVTYALRYIEIPLSLKCKVYRRWSIMAGLSPAFNIYSKVHMNYWEPDQISNIDDVVWQGGVYTSAKEEVEKFPFDYSNKVVLNAIAEINFRIGRIGFMFLNYSGSLSNIYKIEELNGYNMKTKFETITFGFGATL